MAGYTRQSAADIIPTAVVRSAPVNAELNTLRDAFTHDTAGATGHKHDGSSDEGSYVPLIADLDALNKVVVDTATNRISLYNEVAAVAVEQIRFEDGVIYPVTTNDIDLGTGSLQFKDAYFDGTVRTDTLTVDLNATVAGTLGVTGQLNGSTIVASGFTGPITGAVTGNVTGNLTGNVTGNITSVGTSTFTTVDINGGAIDGTVIGSTSAAASNFTTVGTSGQATLASVNIDAGTIDGTTIGFTTPATGAFTTLSATTGITGDVTGAVTGNLTGNVTGNVTGNITGDVTGNVTAATGTSSFNNMTINGSLDMNSGTPATITNLATPVLSADAATKGYVDTSISNLVDAAPGTLDTLNELAAALGDDPAFATTVTNSIATKLPLAGGTMSGAIAMGTSKITGMGDPTTNQDAATKAYVDTQDGLQVSKTGDTMSGELAMGSNKITGLAAPTLAGDATTKTYVDGILGSSTAASASAAAAATSESNAATSEANAATSEANALTYSSNSAASAATAALEADAAAASATSAQLAETNAATTAAALTGFDLEAIAANKAVTATDVFVYDTSKDSDGGAWRKRTQGTSWYQEALNTATRGSRREFPAVAMIVAEATTVTIYDGDDPTLPMWMVFNGNTVFSTGGNLLFVQGGYSMQALVAQDGVICAASGGGIGGLSTIRFVEDTGRLFYQYDGGRYNGNISQRNSNLGFDNGFGHLSLPSGTTNDVAMTVLPDAPIDPATGLPVPTIAVATDGGVSVIKDDGTVESTASAATSKIDYSDGYWYAQGFANFWLSRWTATDALPAGGGSELYIYWGVIVKNTGNTWGQSNLISPISPPFTFVNGSNGGGSQGLVLTKGGASSYGLGMLSAITSDYNTGWMNGDIKGAFLSDTDTASLVASEYVVDGTFDIGTNWTLFNATISGGVLSLNGAGGATSYALDDGNGIVAGKAYEYSFEVVSVSAAGSGVRLRVGSTSNTPIVSSTGTYSGVIVASGTDRIQVDGRTDFVGTIDNVSIKEAAQDRSVNNNGLVINGTVTRAPVATGAELVAYSGFSATNYLEQPYNADLDFGTGDFCVMGWIKTASDGQYVMDRSTSGGLSRWYIHVQGGFITSNSAPAGSITVNNNIWHQVAVVRKSGVSSVYVDGQLDVSGANVLDIEGSNSPKLYPALRYSLSGGMENLTLLRISATAPTAEQIAKIYEDEKFLFQENAAATLFGTSDAVTALAHDSDTDLLHVGTSAGRSVFDGLRRVSNTTTAVGTAISASNGLVVEE